MLRTQRPASDRAGRARKLLSSTCSACSSESPGVVSHRLLVGHLPGHGWVRPLALLSRHSLRFDCNLSPGGVEKATRGALGPMRGDEPHERDDADLVSGPGGTVRVGRSQPLVIPSTRDVSRWAQSRWRPGRTPARSVASIVCRAQVGPQAWPETAAPCRCIRSSTSSPSPRS